MRFWAVVMLSLVVGMLMALVIQKVALQRKRQVMAERLREEIRTQNELDAQIEDLRRSTNGGVPEVDRRLWPLRREPIILPRDLVDLERLDQENPRWKLR